MVCVAIDNNVVLRPTKSPVDQNVDQSLFHSPVKLRFAFGQFISFDLACALPLQCLYFALNLHCFFIPLLFFLPLVSSLACPSSDKPKNMSCCLLPGCTQLILILDLRMSCILFTFFSSTKYLSRNKCCLQTVKKTPGICIFFVNLLSKKISMLLS